MAAGYELTQIRPGAGEYKTVPKAIRPILQFIFEDGFPHSISKVCHSSLFLAVVTTCTDLYYSSNYNCMGIEL